MKPLERSANSSTNMAAFSKARLVINPAAFPSVAIAKREQLMTVIAESQLPDSVTSSDDGPDPGSDSNKPPRPIIGFVNRNMLNNPLTQIASLDEVRFSISELREFDGTNGSVASLRAMDPLRAHFSPIKNSTGSVA
jgi:hypothetical protein